MKKKKKITFDEKLNCVSEVANKDDLEKIFSRIEHDQFTDIEIKLSEKKNLTQDEINFVDQLFNKMSVNT